VAKIQKFNGFRAVSRGGASPLYAIATRNLPAADRKIGLPSPCSENG
jgi:hypothetical protein